ncbi:MAG: phosphate ABC transporter ATP-binding protein, partial [Deltaproteobacteria bacterium]|nr:phosphate ABC transporter ATP-binding protein [Deltaproteobacteria bacterium]
MTAPPIITAEKVSLWYGSFRALEDVSFTIDQGEIVSLIGPSGCGKSTLIRCMNRMNDAPTTRTTGQLVVSGYDVQAPTTDVLALRRDVGMVFQRPNALPLSIRENVLFGVRLHARGTPKPDQDALLEGALRDVGLWDQVKDKLDSHAESLSLEARQKLCIARLLPLKPKVLLMDEPCSALDPEGIGAIEELMGQLRGRYSQVIVTHNMQQARRISDRCMYMLLGKLIEFAPTHELFT